ncbi:hypothetical protein BJX64DRAFT_298807 [Aspergillus heterothallicus]
MKLIYTLCPLALLLSRVSAEGKDPLDVLGNIEALANLKQFVSIASTLSSLVDDNNGQGSGSPLDKLGKLNFHNARDTDSDSDPEEDADDADPLDLNQPLAVLSQMKHVAGIASTLLDLVGERDPATGEKLKNVGEVSQEQPIEPVDILGGIKALQQFASLASGIGSLLDVDSRVDDKKEEEAAGGEREAPPPPPKKQKQTTQRKPAAQEEPVDFIARLDAIKTITTLASKFSSLTDSSSDASPIERVQALMNDPDVSNAFQYISANAHKVFTPEVLDAAKAFLRTSNLIPPEYREFAAAAIDTLAAVFSQKFAADYARAMDTISRVGIDLGPVLTSGFEIVQWVLKTFDQEYIAWISREVMIWQTAITSPQMDMLTAYLSDPETLAKVVGFIEKVKKALTAQRIHALHALFEEEGILDMEDGEYVEFGGRIGERFRVQFTTEEGLTELKGFLLALEEVLRTGALDVAARVMQMRAPVVVPALAGDIHSIYVQSAVVVDILSKLAEALQDFVNIMHPMLEFEVRAARVTSWEFWAELNTVVEKFSAIPASSLTAVHELLVTLSRVLEPEHVPSLRLLNLDSIGTLSEPRVLGSVPVNVPGNISGMVMGTEVEMLGLVESAPVLEAEDLENVLALLRRLDAALLPGEVEQVRETLAFLNKVSAFVVQVEHVFETEEHGDFVHHDEL